MASDPSSKPAKPRPSAQAAASAKPAKAVEKAADQVVKAARRSESPKGSARAVASDESAKKAKSEAEHADWSNSVMQFVRNLFVKQVRLERKGSDIHVVFQDAVSTQSGHSVPVPVQSSTSEAKPSHAALLGISSNQLKRMRHQLSAVLDLHPSTRSVFPHLNYLDKSLRRQGADCFRDLPVEILHKALKQLDTLVQSSRPGPVGLAELRACLVVSAVDRGTPETEADEHAEPSGLSSHLSDFHANGQVSIHEVSHSDFMKANQQWDAAGETIKLKP